MHATFAADTALLGAAERGAQVAQEPAVDPGDAHVDCGGHAVRAFEVLGPDRGREAIAVGVGQRHDFGLGIEGADMAAGAKNLFAHHGRGFGQAGPDGGLHPGAFGQIGRHVRHATSGDQGGTLGHCFGVVRKHLALVLLADQGPVVRSGITGSAVLDRLAARLQRRDEALEQRALHVHALGAQADLAGVHKGRAEDAFHGGVEVAVGKHDARVLAAQLEAHAANAIGRGLHDGAAGAGFAGEGDAVDFVMVGQKLTGGVRSEAVHHVVNAGRHANRVHDLAQQRGRGRRFLRRFDHHGVAAGQGRADLPGHQQEGRIPGADHANHTLGLADGVVQGPGAVRRVHHESFRRHVLDDVGKNLEVGSAAWHKGVCDHVVRLPGVGLFGGDKVVKALGDAVGHSVQHGHALVHRHAAPVAAQGIARGHHGGVDVVPCAFGHEAHQMVVSGRALLEGLAVGSRLEFAVDEMGCGLHGRLQCLGQ